MSASRKLVVTGAQGFVAGSVLAQAGESWEVHALTRTAAGCHPERFHWHVCDPLDTAALSQLFHAVRPDAIIHTAALADIDFCQANPNLARSVNVDFTRRLVDLSKQTNTHFVFCSTDTVFNGEHAPYRETDPPGAVNLYAETKIEAEQIVATLGSGSVIARLALVVGLPIGSAGNSFLVRMLQSFQAGRVVSVTQHEIRTPLDVITAGQALLELADKRLSGIVHLAGLSRVTRYELNQAIADRFGYSRSLVAPQAPAASAGRAPRPRDASLLTNRATAELKTPMRTLDDALTLILQPPGARHVPGRSPQKSGHAPQ